MPLTIVIIFGSMELMKKLQFALISLIIISSIGCGSTPVLSEQDALVEAPSTNEVVDAAKKPVEVKDASSKKLEEEELPGIYFKNKQTKQKLRIDDWKYMGFGEDLPNWLVPALEEDMKALKKNVPDLSSSDFKVLTAIGCNRDQAENAMADLEKPEGYTLYDSFWVRVLDPKNENSEKYYISVALYYVNLVKS